MKQRTKRLKTESDQISSELLRQKSIFSNLNWQIKQRDKKIIFLQKYYRDLKRVVSRQVNESKALQQRISKYQQESNSPMKHSPKLIRFNEYSEMKNNKRIITEMYQSYNEQPNDNQFMMDHYRSHLLQKIS